jgi:DNA-binding MarR family transcriptional regulator
MRAMDEQDWADRHVARWRDHWIDVSFEVDVEAIVVRCQRLVRHWKLASHEALTDLGLQDFEYETLHMLMIRDTPGQASPTRLAQDLGISGAGLTGRIDALEKAGWIQRQASAHDRRRVDIEVTKAGIAMWRRAMAGRGRAEDEVVHVLDDEERATLSRLLKKMTLLIDDDPDT